MNIYYSYYYIKLTKKEYFLGKKQILKKDFVQDAVAGIRTRVVGLEGPSNNQTIPRLHKKCGVRDLNPGL